MVLTTIELASPVTLSLLALNSICDSRGEIKLFRFVSVPRDVTSISQQISAETDYCIL